MDEDQQQQLQEQNHLKKKGQKDDAGGFGSGVISLGELQAMQVRTLERIWSSDDGKAVFFKPAQLPEGYHALGHYARDAADTMANLEISPLLVVRSKNGGKDQAAAAALSPPVDYTLIWTSSSSTDGMSFWMPVAPAGYKVLGYVVSKNKPGLDEVVCVREDLTTESTISKSIWEKVPASSSSEGSCNWFRGSINAWRFITGAAAASPSNSNSSVRDGPASSFYVWQTRPLVLSTTAKGLSTGTFYCSSSAANVVKGASISGISTLQNLEPNLDDAMPCLQEVDQLVRRYAPRVLLHPDEEFFPASVTWFFEQGALLYSKQDPSKPQRIPSDGSNLPVGETNDGKYWLDLPSDSEAANRVRKGNLDSATAYVHVKPMYGGTVTDLQFWLYYTFNGPATLKLGPLDVKLGKIGEHVSDWEHFTLRVDNFTGNLSSVYLGHHSSGTWYQPSELQYEKNSTRLIVYASKHGHAMYAYPGDNLQGDEKRGVGIRNDTKASNYTWDLNTKYQLVSAPYLNFEEPTWLQYMREWGPKVEYNSRSELEKIIGVLPKKLRRSVEDLFDKFPNELSGEEGPTGPKEKNFWLGDER